MLDGGTPAGVGRPAPRGRRGPRPRVPRLVPCPAPALAPSPRGPTVSGDRGSGGIPTAEAGVHGGHGAGGTGPTGPGAGGARRACRWPSPSGSSRSSARSAPRRASRSAAPLDLFAVVLLLIGPVALALLTRRSRVPLVTAVVGAATAVYLVLGYPYGPVVASLVVALVAAVVTGHRLTAWLVAAGVLAAHGAAVVRDPDRGWSWAGATATLAWALLVLAFGEVVRVRRERGLSHRRALAEERRRQAGRVACASRRSSTTSSRTTCPSSTSRRRWPCTCGGRTPSRSTSRCASSRVRARRRSWSSDRSSRCCARGRASTAPSGRQPGRARRPRGTHRYAGLDVTADVTGTRPPCLPVSSSRRTGSCRRR